MARPTLMKKGRPVKVYLPDALIKEASKLAFQKNDSLSGLIRRLLESETRSRKAA